MLKYLLLISLLFVILSCSIQKENSTWQKNNILGIWTEHWGNDTIDAKTDVTYVDTLRFYKNLIGNIKITCINNSNYIYREVSIKDSTISFTMENISSRTEKFLVHYKFLFKNENELDGRIVNSKNKTVKVKLFKI